MSFLAARGRLFSAQMLPANCLSLPFLLFQLSFLAGLLKELANLEPFCQRPKHVTCHVRVKACIVLLPTSLEVVGKLRGRLLIVGKHQVIADALVLLTAIKEVGQGCLVEFAGARCQRLCVVRCREEGSPLASELNIGLREALDELLEDESCIKHHVMANNRFFGGLQVLNHSHETTLPLVVLLNFCLLFKSQITRSRSSLAVDTRVRPGHCCLRFLHQSVVLGRTEGSPTAGAPQPAIGIQCLV